MHEQIATWGVPLRWFVFVDLAERELVLEPRPAGRCVTGRRSPRPAGGRHRALSVLRKSVGDAPITEAVEEGARWLEEFHPRSVVELDYGGLVDLLSDDELRAGRLARAGRGGPGRAVAEGDAEAATEAYEKLVDRWRAVQLLERCN